MQRIKIGSGHLVIQQGDLTTLAVDAIVNAANSRLAGGGGVDGAIHRAAGIVDLRAACQGIIEEIGSLPTGEAVLTPGFALEAKYIIHTVGPIWHGGGNNEAQLLRNAYLNSATLAGKRGLKRIAFPAISCGAYGYPVEDAARIAVSAVKEALEAGLVEEVVLAMHTEVMYDEWIAAATELQ